MSTPLDAMDEVAVAKALAELSQTLVHFEAFDMAGNTLPVEQVEVVERDDYRTMFAEIAAELAIAGYEIVRKR